MTLRETYIQALIALFKATPGFPAMVERSLVVAFAYEEGSVVVVHRGKEDPDNSMTGVTDRTCEILISVITRSAVPDQVADEVMEVVHPLVMHFTAANLMRVLEGQTDEPKFSGTDTSACLMATHYTLLYRTIPDSLSA
jgi:hypothetical protein